MKSKDECIKTTEEMMSYSYGTGIVAGINMCFDDLELVKPVIMELVNHYTELEESKIVEGIIDTMEKLILEEDN